MPTGNHTVDISLDKYAPVSGRSVIVNPNQMARFTQPLTALPPPPPSSGSISISTNPGAQVSLNGQRKGIADGSGQITLEGIAPGSYQVEVALDDFLPTQVPVKVVAGSNTVIPARLQPKPVAVAAKPTPAAEPPPPPVAAAVDPAVAETPGIQAALNSFVSAYRSKNIAAIQANWTNIGPTRSKNLASVFQNAEVVNLSESCEGTPVISGNTATYQNCVESSQYMKGEPLRKLNKTITFTKTGGKWVMKDKLP